MIEIWQSVENYPKYQVSNLGNIKSLNYNKTGKEKLLKLTKGNHGYLYVNLCKDGIAKPITVHQLVAITFLNHKPLKFDYVVNHKDFNKLNNSVHNLEIVTNRENSNQKHLKSSSKYTGVSWHKKLKKWRSVIYLNGNNKHLGYFESELEAHEAYKNKLKEIVL